MLVTQSRPTLCDPRTVNTLGSSVHGILPLEWGAFPSPGDLPNPGIGPASPTLASGFFSTEPSAKPGGVSSVHYKYFAPFCDLSSQLW